MKQLNLKTDISARDVLVRVAFVVVSTIIIVWFMPRGNMKFFKFVEGEPWMGETVISPFEFPIYKTEEAIQAEKDSLLKHFEPYYNYNADTEERQIARFQEAMNNGENMLPADIVRIVVEHMHKFYQAGIMASTEYNELAKDSNNMVRVVSGKTVKNTRITTVYSTFAAYEQLFLDERLSAQRHALQRCNMNEYLVPNLIYDKSKTESEKNDICSSVPIASGVMKKDLRIVSTNDKVDAHTARILSSLERELQRRETTTNKSRFIAGQAIYVGILIILFTLYLDLFRKDYFEKTRSIMMLYTMVTIFPVIASLLYDNSMFPIYAVPFAIAPIFVRVFMDSRTAFITHAVIILICAAMVKSRFEFIVVEMVAGLVAVFSLRELSQRAQLFKTAVLVTLASSLMYFAMQIMEPSNSFQQINISHYQMMLLNGVSLLFAYPLMYIVEKAFGFVSNVTLIELSNTSKDLLRRLSEVAPGTFQHSITVGNLAAEIANRIEADALLVRTGALYHDIGKMFNPAFFTENQAGVNPLEKMSLTEAAQVVISHVTEGVRLAEKNNLPQNIKDFIVTHHGKGMTRYFYVSYKNQHPKEKVDEKLFSYPGPDPFTREQAILMMADTVEAASRSLPEYTEESISALVNRLIDGQVQAGYFTNCPITFRDIRTAKLVLIERLKAIYHTRISYPELKKPGSII